jgi:hypothetical protein
LPSDASERHLGGEVENDDFAAFRHDRVHGRSGRLTDNGRGPWLISIEASGKIENGPTRA